MITMQAIVGVCWVIFLLYWLISARSVKPTQETRGWLRGNWYPILYTIGALLMINFRFLSGLGIPTKTLTIVLLPPTRIVNTVAVILLIVGLVIAVTARRTLAGNWSNAVALKKDHELITTGPYQYVRHPIYTGMLLMFLGTALSLGTLGADIGFLIILVGILFKLKQEETLMTEYFAEEYIPYKNRTRMLIPFLW